MTRVSVLDTRHESEDDVSDDWEDDRDSEAGEMRDRRQIAQAGATYSGGSLNTV